MQHSVCKKPSLRLSALLVAVMCCLGGCDDVLPLASPPLTVLAPASSARCEAGCDIVSDVEIHYAERDVTLVSAAAGPGETWLSFQIVSNRHSEPQSRLARLDRGSAALDDVESPPLGSAVSSLAVDADGGLHAIYSRLEQTGYGYYDGLLWSMGPEVKQGGERLALRGGTSPVTWFADSGALHEATLAPESSSSLWEAFSGGVFGLDTNGQTVVAEPIEREDEPRRIAVYAGEGDVTEFAAVDDTLAWEPVSLPLAPQPASSLNTVPWAVLAQSSHRVAVLWPDAEPQVISAAERFHAECRVSIADCAEAPPCHADSVGRVDNSAMVRTSDGSVWVAWYEYRDDRTMTFELESHDGGDACRPNIPEDGSAYWVRLVRVAGPNAPVEDMVEFETAAPSGDPELTAYGNELALVTHYRDPATNDMRMRITRVAR